MVNKNNSRSHSCLIHHADLNESGVCFSSVHDFHESQKSMGLVFRFPSGTFSFCFFALCISTERNLQHDKTQKRDFQGIKKN